MRPYRALLFLLFKQFIYLVSASESVKSKVTFLSPDEVIHVLPETRRLGFYTNELKIFCYEGSPKSFWRIFQSVQLNLKIDSDDFTQYEGSTPEIVQERYDKQTTIFHYFLSNKKTQLKLNPFNQTCIGIDTLIEYKIKLHLIRIDFWKVVCLIIGLLIFFYANILSHNALFYYLSGILLGIFASILILVYFSSKLFPRRPMMYGVLLCGWSLAIYLFQMLLENIQVILVTYQTYVFWYVLITGFISFIICYRFGPPENQRSRDLIKWGLQLASLLLIFYSSEFKEASAALIIITLYLYYFPRKWLRKIQAYYLTKFPPKRRYLTNEEYYEQGVKETEKALNELRKYANSSECKQWRVVSQLKDPIRFASFVEGNSHVSDQEILEYETSRDVTDSELSEDEEENNVNYEENIENEEDGEDDEDNENVNNSRNFRRYSSKENSSNLISPNGLRIRERLRRNTSNRQN